ncbi:MAG: VWA domain-containing protein [Planctomycetes bacterium]|nr:VWA domain-containing protein [Planctomycetota bacterium]
MIDALSFTRLQDPAWLLVLLLPLALWFVDRARGRGQFTQSLGPAFLLNAVPTGFPWALSIARVLHGFGIVILALAMARPVERVALPPEREGVEILLVVDRSSSMGARDLDPVRDRLAVAIDAASQFVEARGEDRIGLIAFARYPDLLSPTSLDHMAVLALLHEVEIVERDSPEDLTGIGAAVARAAQVLATREAQSKVIVLLTDGKENVATPIEPGSLRPLEAAALCRAFGVRVYPIAVASEDPDNLHELARETGGRAFAAQDMFTLEQVFASIDRLAKSPFAEARFEDQNRFMAWLFCATLLLFAGLALRHGPGEVLP